MASGTVASATLITFDDLAGGPIPNGYEGFDWNNFYVEGGGGIPGTGYQYGLISSPNTAYNGSGNPASWVSSSTPFTLNSAYITGAWNNGLQVNVIGYNGGTELYDNTYTVSESSPTLIIFNYVGVTEVYFKTSGGTPVVGLHGSGTQMAMDNVTINGAVPEPTTLISGAMLLLSFGSGAFRQLRKKFQAV